MMATEKLAQTKTRIPQPEAEIFLQIALAIGNEFLACGGPVTRLESQLVLAGFQSDFEVNVQATPTGLIVSCFAPLEGRTYTRVSRTYNFSVDLGHLRAVDRLLGNLANGSISPLLAIVRLNRIIKKRQPVPFYLHAGCLVGIGASATVLAGAPATIALAAGAFTLCVDILIKALSSVISLKKMFRDFLSCFFSLFFSYLLGSLFHIPSTALAIGTLAYIVPGLLLTTAISEAMEQNYLSSTIRLIKTFYTFLSMALAYYLVNELALNMNLNTLTNTAFNINYSLPIKMLCTGIIISCFSLKFGAHQKSLARILFCGLAGAFTFIFLSSQLSIILSSFLAAFVIGYVSYYLSRKYNHPSQIYSVPSILALVPGMLAFSSFGFGQGLQSEINFSTNFSIQALLVAVAIVFGLAAGRVPHAKES